MRCPKCGYISFDNVDTCLKCNKDISEAAKAFQGSTLNVVTPVFLRFSESGGDEDLDVGDVADDDGDIEFADPDLEILVDDEEDDQEDGIAFSLGEEEPESAGDEEVVLAEEFGEMAAFADEDTEDDDFSMDLGQFEDAQEEETLEFQDRESEAKSGETTGVNIEIPEELADISDLSAPSEASSNVTEAVEEQAVAREPEAEPETLSAELEDDLDFSSLDLDLDAAGQPEAAADEADTGASGTKKTSRAGGADMDEDLNFDLDLGGLSIHDDK